MYQQYLHQHLPRHLPHADADADADADAEAQFLASLGSSRSTSVLAARHSSRVPQAQSARCTPHPSLQLVCTRMPLAA